MAGYLCNKVRLAVGHQLRVALLCALWLSQGGLALGAANTKAAKELSDAFAAAASQAMPAVVLIRIEKSVEVASTGYNDPFGLFNDDRLKRFFGDQWPPAQRAPQRQLQKGQGSGFIISKDGYILTNNHVVGDVDKITVDLKDGRSVKAKLVGTDPGSEVALIKIPGDDLPVLPMGDSDKIAIGDWVIAIGNPFGLNETVTVGVISAKGRSNVHIAAYEDFIQTDAAINPGNSGGPLIDLDGKVIGINTAIFSESGGYMGIGFAIPINMARSIEEQLKKYGKVTRGYVGLSGQDLTEDMATLSGVKGTKGVIVAGVEKGSPADRAGLTTDDVIVALNGKKLDSYDAFRNEIAVLKPGTKVTLQVLREGKTRDVEVTLGERPSELAKAKPSRQAPQPVQSPLGLEVQDLTPDLAQRLGYTLGQGVIVSGVVSGSSAADVGIQAGDLILSVNRQRVNSAEAFDKAIRAVKGGKVLLLVRRGDASQYVVLSIPE
jgi:serine protease Do